MDPIREILPGIIGKTKRSKRRPGWGTRLLFPALDILRPAWEQIVGEGLARRTRPISIVNNHLVVEAPDSVWRSQLVRIEGAILAKIHHMLGDDTITGVDWKLNPALGVTPPAAPPRIPPQRELDPAVREAAEAISDPELRELFLRQAERMTG